MSQTTEKQIEIAKQVKACEPYLSRELREQLVTENLREATYAVPASKFPPQPLPPVPANHST